MELCIITTDNVKSTRKVRRCYEVKSCDLETVANKMPYAIKILVGFTDGSVTTFMLREDAGAMLQKVPASDHYSMTWKLQEVEYILKMPTSAYSTVCKIATTFKYVSVLHHDGAAVTKKWLEKLLHKDSDHSNVTIV